MSAQHTITIESDGFAMGLQVATLTTESGACFYGYAESVDEAKQKAINKAAAAK